MILLAYKYPTGPNSFFLGNVGIDATLSEQHAIAAQVTEHQVERGSAITDHIRPMPRRFTVEGLISNTPIALAGFSRVTQKGYQLTHTRGAREFQGKMEYQAPNGEVITFSATGFDGEMDRARDVFADLAIAAQSGALFTVTTFFETYENMAIANFSVPRDSSAGNDLRFSIEFVQVRFVDARKVDALAKHPEKKKRQPDHKGSKPAQEAPADKRSALRRLAQSFLGAK